MGRFSKIYKFGFFLFVLQLCLHSISYSFSAGDYIFRRTRTVVSSAKPQSLEEITQALKTEWNIGERTLISNQTGVLAEKLQVSGLSPSAFTDFSSLWLDLYLNTVLSEGGLLDQEKSVRDAVLMVKRIMEANSFATLFGDRAISTEVLNLLENLSNDLHRDSFSKLLSGDKENILWAVAETLPYEKRLSFYIAFQPQLYEICNGYYESAKKEAKGVFDDQVRIWVSKLGGTYTASGTSSGIISYRTSSSEIEFIEISMTETPLPLSTLIPTHKVSTDIGMGSSSFRNRSAEIDKGIFVPLSIVQIYSSGFGVRNYIAEGHARAAAYLEKGIEFVPTFVVRVKGVPIDLAVGMQSDNEALGLSNIEDIVLGQLSLPDPINLEGSAAGVLISQDPENFLDLVGNAIIRTIVDSVKDKGHADILISVKDLGILSDAIFRNARYLEYLEDKSSVRIILYASEDTNLESLDIFCSNLGISRENVSIIQTTQDLVQLRESGRNIDFAISDFTTIATDDTIPTMLTESDTKAVVVVSDRKEGLLVQDTIVGQDSRVMGVLNNPDNLLLSDTSYIEILLPKELRPLPGMIELDTISGVSEALQPVISDIELALAQARNLGRPCYVGVDGWLGSGIRGVVVNYLRNNFPGYKSKVLNVDNYRLPVDRTRKETSSPITIPNVGETVSSDIDIEVTRIDSARIAIRTQFDETVIPIPAIGREVKLAGHAIFIKRKNADTLEIRLSPAITHLELGRLYRDIQLLREGETVYVPFVDADNKRVVVSEVDRLALIQENEPLRSSEGRQLRRIANPKDSWRAISPNSSFWLDIQTGDVLYELNPNECEIIFIAGELSLHQESVNLLYDVRLFVDAEFSERIERAVRYHILTGYYFGKTVAELETYMESQRTELEDPFLFDDREQASYIITNKILADETMLQQLHGMSLSQRIDKAIKVAEAEKINDPWNVLENYILPITGRGSNFRIALEYIINTHRTNPTTFSEIDFVGLIDSAAEPFSLLNESDKWNLYVALCNIGLIRTQNKYEHTLTAGRLGVIP